MTTLTNRTARALLVVDVQVDVMKAAHDRDAVIAAIALGVDKARAAGVPVVWVQHSDEEMPLDSPGWQIVPELVPAAGEAIVRKLYGDSFEDTDLEAVLAESNIGSLYVSGAQTDACIRSTIHGALARGYDAVLISDAHTTEDLSAWGAPQPAQVIAHTNMYWQYQKAPGRTAGIVTSEDLSFA